MTAAAALAIFSRLAKSASSEFRKELFSGSPVLSVGVARTLVTLGLLVLLLSLVAEVISSLGSSFKSIELFGKTKLKDSSEDGLGNSLEAEASTEKLLLLSIELTEELKAWSDLKAATISLC